VSCSPAGAKPPPTPNRLTGHGGSHAASRSKSRQNNPMYAALVGYTLSAGKLDALTVASTPPALLHSRATVLADKRRPVVHCEKPERCYSQDPTVEHPR
jgi:hypothetical protein